MKAEDIKVGMWVRTRGGLVCRTVAKSEWSHEWEWDLVDLDGRGWLLPIDRLEPWTPQVGEWVRFVGEWAKACPVPWIVEDVAVEGIFGRSADRAMWGTPAVKLLEPCLPPAPPTTHLRADGVEVPAKAVPCGPVAMHANSTCLRCGGPAYLGLQFAECLAPKCERVELEPEVEEVWIMPTSSEQEIDQKSLALAAEHREKVYTAYGERWVVSHPIREEAIRLWREAVRRG